MIIKCENKLEKLKNFWTQKFASYGQYYWSNIIKDGKIEESLTRVHNIGQYYVSYGIAFYKDGRFPQWFLKQWLWIYYSNFGGYGTKEDK